MTNIIKLLALIICLGAAVFYCSISNAGWGKSTGILADICTNQAITAGDGCDVYVITD